MSEPPILLPLLMFCVWFELKIILRKGTTVIIEKAPNNDARILKTANLSLCVGYFAENENMNFIFFKKLQQM